MALLQALGLMETSENDTIGTVKNKIKSEFGLKLSYSHLHSFIGAVLINQTEYSK